MTSGRLKLATLAFIWPARSSTCGVRQHTYTLSMPAVFEITSRDDAAILSLRELNGHYSSPRRAASVSPRTVVSAYIAFRGS